MTTNTVDLPAPDAVEKIRARLQESVAYTNPEYHEAWCAFAFRAPYYVHKLIKAYDAAMAENRELRAQLAAESDPATALKQRAQTRQIVDHTYEYVRPSQPPPPPPPARVDKFKEISRLFASLADELEGEEQTVYADADDCVVDLLSIQGGK